MAILTPLADASAAPPSASTRPMDALYRAALGPVQLPRYLALFERFDQAGRAPAGWNLTASLATLNWMLLHQLWTAALVYVALVEGLALLIFGVGRPLLHWPVQVEWGLIAAFAMFAIVLPGLFGDALLHSEIRKRTARALVAAQTIPEACELLARQASSWRRLWAIAAANVVLFSAIALAWVLVPPSGWGNANPAPPPMASGQVQTAALPALAAPAPAPADLTNRQPSPDTLNAPPDTVPEPARDALPPPAPPDAPEASASTSPTTTTPEAQAADTRAQAPAASEPEPAKTPAPPTPEVAQAKEKTPTKTPEKTPEKAPEAKTKAAAAPANPAAAPPPPSTAGKPGKQRAPTAPPAPTAATRPTSPAPKPIPAPVPAAPPTPAKAPAAPVVPAPTPVPTAAREQATAPTATPAPVSTPVPTSTPNEAPSPAPNPAPPASAAPAPDALANPGSAEPAPAKKPTAPDAIAAPAAAPVPAPAAAAPAAAPSAALGSAPGYYLNVGLFADEANARRTQSRLLNASLPAFRQTFSTPNGERTRVRVGPFGSEAEAQKAATQIRSMQLDVLMYRQRGG